MRTRVPVAWPGPKRQGAGAVQDAGAKGDGLCELEASWIAVDRHRFSPKRDVIYGNALKELRNSDGDRRAADPAPLLRFHARPRFFKTCTVEYDLLSV
jgi:hypothetical protein